MRETGVALAPGVGFGRDGEGYIRVCFASTEATVTEALDTSQKFVMSRAVITEPGCGRIRLTWYGSRRQESRTIQYEVVDPRDLRRGQCALVPDLRVRWRAALVCERAPDVGPRGRVGRLRRARACEFSRRASRAPGEPWRALSSVPNSQFAIFLAYWSSGRSVPASLHISTSCLK